MAIKGVFDKTNNGDFAWLGERLLNDNFNPEYVLPEGARLSDPTTFDVNQYYRYLPKNLLLASVGRTRLRYAA